MKKTYNPISDVRNESVDITKRLYRSISDVVHSLDDQRGRASAISDLFVHSLEAQRMKLRDYCERLIFFDPVGYGRKGEELLWRKGYYDVVSTAKRLRKGPLWKPGETCQLRSHLQSGIGHYHHLLLRLQLDFKIDLQGIIDFPLLVNDIGLKKGKSNASNVKDKLDSDGLEWANTAVHRCLIYLGDLSRYLADLCPGYHLELPARYYYQALNWKPEAGMPYNQLGTLAGTKNFTLDAAYYYMRCMQCSQSFEGAEGNLAGVLERNARWIESGVETNATLHHLIARFLYIADICFFDKVAQQGVQKVCEEILSRMNTCLSESHLPEQPVDPDDVDTTREVKQPQYLTDEMLFKMAVIALMCMQHVQEKSSDQVNMMMALILAVMSQLIEKALERIECTLTPRQPPVVTKMNGHNKRRRRRRRRKDSSVSSDSSEDDVEIVNSDSDLSEEELVFDAHSSDSEAEEENVNGLDKEKVVDDTTKYNMSVLGEHPSLKDNTTMQHVQLLCEQGFLLQTIKVCCDWLVSNAEVLRLCGQSSKLLISRLVSLLNHLAPIPVILEKNCDTLVSLPEVNKQCVEIPLVEDVYVRGLVALKLTHSSIDWSKLRTGHLTSKQEAYIRICKLVYLGQQLTTQDGANILYNNKDKWFSCSAVEEPNEETQREENTESGPPQNKGKLMQDMGQLWLRAEVRELETKVKRTAHLPPYLVLDCDSLIHHIVLVKQLVSSRKFIVLIPSIVVSELDEQKRTSRRVRDTIRWLETQFHHGNRFLRAQRNNEHLTLPLIKYPKKKDKEAWLYFQVVECCHYLSLNNVDKDANSAKSKDSLVTLLTGNKNLLSPTNSNGFSPLGVAKSAGINVEHIETFHSKWKNSSKSHG